MKDLSVRETISKYGVEYVTPLSIAQFITGVSEEVISKYDSLKELFNKIETVECTELQKDKLIALKQICRVGNKDGAKGYSIKNPWDIYKFYMEDMRYESREIFKVVMLSTKNEIIKDYNASVGTLTSSLVHPREIFKEAILNSARSVVLIHNHPSGNTNPSENDKDTTNRLIKCGDLLGIAVLDHIIIGDGHYFSFKENNLM